ncbi:DUF3566 domain-containing protein [uncultured Jatrophihabitans sp.]|uniref:DUF3566 domain-containing protein n=1 Tax=uncultured Jatrophihabitans sp. TaxID=1610747 RepID=UPI0035CBA4FE
MTEGGASSGPPAQQAAPRSPDYGFSTPQHTTAGNGSSAWNAGPAAPAGYGGTSADSPTGALPVVPVDGSPTGATTSTAATPGSAPSKPRSAGNRGPRRARLQLRHINPWTVLKFSCVLSIALFFVWLIVVGVLFGILDGAGIISKINDTVTTIQGGDAQAPVTAGVVFGGAAIIGVVNVVLFIALSTVGSLVYNLCADLVGGIEITLSER